MQIKQIAMQLTESVHFAPRINPLADFIILLKSQPKLILANPHKKFQIIFMENLMCGDQQIMIPGKNKL